jgi:aldehyde:ferredoxin oxidoreductase
VEVLNYFSGFPSYNFKRGRIDDDDAYSISGQYMVEAGYMKRPVSCHSCPIGCHRYTRIDQGDLAGTYSGGPQFETLGTLGAGCGITDIETVIKANELCNILGLDTSSTGSTIQWLLECGERGVVSNAEADGLELKWGNRKTVIELVKKIAYRSGIGDLLADGVRQAAAVVGHDSWKWAVQAKGLELTRSELRTSKGYALAYAVNPRGADHLHAPPIAEWGGRPQLIRLIEEITGDAKYANPNLVEKRAEIVRWYEDWVAVIDSVGMCMIVNLSMYPLPPQLVADLFNAAVDENLSEDELLYAGRRILTLEKCINARQGLTRKDDTLPWRMMHEDVPSRPGEMNSPEELDLMLDQYYDLHGWDKDTGLPTRSTLQALGLNEQFDELERLGILAP